MRSARDDLLLPSSTSSGWVSATSAERWAASARRSLPTSLAHRDQQLDVLVGALAAHGLDVEVLEALLDALEGGGVGAEHPLEQRRQEARSVERAGVA